MIRKIALVLLLWISPQLGLASADGSALFGLNSFVCLSEVEFKKQVDDFAIQLETFEAPYKCEAGNELYKISSALYLLEQLRFEKTGQFAFVDDLKQDEFVGYLKRELKNRGGIMRADLGCGMFAIACANSRLGLMTIGSAAFDEQTSVFDVAATLLHETRHLQSAKFNHVRCTNTLAVRMGEFACDENIWAQGSYGVELQFYLKSAFSSKNFNRASQVANRLSSYAISRTSFNQHPLQSLEVLMLQSQEDELYFYDGENLFETTLKFADSKIMVNSEGVTEPIFRVVPKDKSKDAYAFLYQRNVNLSDFQKPSVQAVILGRTLLDYNTKPASQRADVLDYGFFNLDMYTGWAVTLTDSSLLISPPDFQDFEVALPSAKLVRISHYNPCKNVVFNPESVGELPETVEIAFIDEHNHVYPYILGGPKTKQLLKPACRMGGGVLNYFIYRNQILRLKQEGSVEGWMVDRFATIPVLKSKKWKRIVPIPYMPGIL